MFVSLRVNTSVGIDGRISYLLRSLKFIWTNASPGIHPFRRGLPGGALKLSKDDETREGNEDLFPGLERSLIGRGGLEGDLRRFLLIRVKLISIGLARSGLD